jgi:hypothetical protein
MMKGELNKVYGGDIMKIHSPSKAAHYGYNSSVCFIDEEAFKEKEEDTYDWMAHSPDEIIRDMQTILNRRKCAERYFEHDEWEWEISSDVMHKISSLIECIFCRRNPDEPSSVFSIYVRLVRNKRNHIKLVKKEKENVMEPLFNTKNGILELGGVRYPVRINEVGQDFNEPTHVNLYVTGEGNSNYQIIPKHTGYSACNMFIDESMWIHKGLPSIKDVIFNDPATIVFWADGTKTVVQARDEKFDPEKGLAMAISKKAMGNTRDYYIPFKKWLKKYAPKSCMNCKFSTVEEGNEPCGSCDIYSNWKKK